MSKDDKDKIHVTKKVFEGECEFCGNPAEGTKLQSTALVMRTSGQYATMRTIRVVCDIQKHFYYALDYSSEVLDPSFEETDGGDQA